MMAEIGEPIRRIELIPADEPAVAPVETPVPVEVPV